MAGEGFLQLATREEKIASAKELYSSGSRNYVLKSYEQAVDDFSQVCSLYSELYGEMSNELGMPYLLYAKSLIALTLEENKVIDIDVSDEEDVEDGDENEAGDEIEEGNDIKKENSTNTLSENAETTEKESNNANDNPSLDNVSKEASTAENNEDDSESASNLQVAWEILELAKIIFQKQGKNGFQNLAEVYTELANIEFENNVMQAAREDYEKAIEIYKQLSSSNYRQAIAEIYYKIGLSFLLEQSLEESVKYLKLAHKYLSDEIDDIKNKSDLPDKEKIIKDMEETVQEIWNKVTEIEESMQKCATEVRAAIKRHMNPIPEVNDSSSAGSSLSEEKPKPTDISHLVKRKKPNETPTDNE